MEKIIFGTYNVPSINTNLSASYIAPGIASMEEVNKVVFSEEDKKEAEHGMPAEFFNNLLKGIMSVPKP
jgi:hypothetical protein